MATTTTMKMSSKPAGRPPKLMRDAAVYIARWWRCECLKEAVSIADQWILEHWRDNAPTGKPPGLTDAAHVRAAVRRAKDAHGWLGDANFSLSDGWRMADGSMSVLDQDAVQFYRLSELGSAFQADACVVVAVERTNRREAMCLFWTPGALEAHRGKAILAMPPDPAQAYRAGLSPVAAAIAASVGLSHTGEIVRLNAPEASILKH